MTKMPGRFLRIGKFLKCSRTKVPLGVDIIQGSLFNCTNQLMKFSTGTSTNISPQSATEPVKIKLNNQLFKKIFTPEVNNLAKVFERNGYELRIVGGAVRDLLLNKQPLEVEVDLATTATPKQMEEMFTEDLIRTVYTGGEWFGHFTPKINDKQFRVSSLRLPREKMQSPIKFTTCWSSDASSRDFSINAMYLGFDGTVYDYFNGLEDVDKRKIQFVGEPAARIKDSPIRMIRYFRFYGSICEKPDDHDPQVLEEMMRFGPILLNENPATIWRELKLILKSKFRLELLKTILQLRFATYLGLPRYGNVKELDRLFERAGDLYLHPITILSALIRNEDDMKHLQCWLYMTTQERSLGSFVFTNRREILRDRSLRSYKTMLENSKEKLNARLWIEQALSYHGENELLYEFNKWVESNVCMIEESV